MDFREKFVENKFQVALLGVGVVLLGLGMVKMMGSSQGDEVVVVEAEVQPTIAVKTLVVDVAGAVKNPGVYRMDEGVRIADALAQAGGYADEVDQAYVAKFINQAEMVRDGQKIYVPLKGEESVVVNQKSSVSNGVGEVAGSSVINVNTASESELDELWGVGEARARDIIANRPFSTIEELVTKAKIPQNVIDKNEGKIGL
jgi:competence protein ComEA